MSAGDAARRVAAGAGLHALIDRVFQGDGGSGHAAAVFLAVVAAHDAVQIDVDRGVRGCGRCGRSGGRTAAGGAAGIVVVAEVGIVAAGGTVAPIYVAIAIDGEPIPSTTMTVTPAAVGDFFNVSRTVFIDVPCGCCVTIAVENTSTTAAGVAIPIDVANANIVVERVA